MSKNAIWKKIIHSTAETLEIKRPKLLLLIVFKQQVTFDMEQTGQPRTHAQPESKLLYPSTRRRFNQRITPRTPVTFSVIISDKWVLNIAPLLHLWFGSLDAVWGEVRGDLSRRDAGTTWQLEKCAVLKAVHLESVKVRWGVVASMAYQI